MFYQMMEYILLGVIPFIYSASQIDGCQFLFRSYLQNAFYAQRPRYDYVKTARIETGCRMPVAPFAGSDLRGFRFYG